MYKGLKEAWPKFNEKWVETLNLSEEAYNGGHRNACRNLLKTFDRLESADVQNEAWAALKYVLPLCSFEKSFTNVLVKLNFLLSRKLLKFSSWVVPKTACLNARCPTILQEIVLRSWIFFWKRIDPFMGCWKKACFLQDFLFYVDHNSKKFFLTSTL